MRERQIYPTTRNYSTNIVVSRFSLLSPNRQKDTLLLPATNQRKSEPEEKHLASYALLSRLNAPAKSTTAGGRACGAVGIICQPRQLLHALRKMITGEIICYS